MSSHTHMHAFTLRVALGLCLVLSFVSVVRSAPLTATFISDIHYDPLYGTDKAYSMCTSSAKYSVWGVAGCDASPQLVQRALDDVSALNTSFIFYGGDWQRHHYADSGLASRALFSDLSERFRNVTVTGRMGQVAFSGSLGNNDVVPDYYFAWNSSESVRELGERVQAMETAGLVTAAEATVMSKCGYYTHETPTLNVIVIHTLLWAFRLQPTLPTSEVDPCGQFEFLRSELKRTKESRRRAVIIGHIPPGLNAYKVLDDGFTTVEENMFWKPQYQTTYDSIIREHADVVAIQLFGHTHKFAPQVFPSNGALSMIMPAISPIFFNNPSYLKAVFMENTWDLEDVEMRYATKNGVFHAGLSAKAALKLHGHMGDLPRLRASITALATDTKAWDDYLQMFCGGETHREIFPDGECDDTCRYVVVCSLLENDYGHIQRCVHDFTERRRGPPAGTSGWVTALIVILSIVGLGMAVVLVLMGRSGQTTLSWSNFQRVEWWKSLLQKRAPTPLAEEMHVEDGAEPPREKPVN